MKKGVIAVFSISLTAGTLYLAYSELKDFFIRSLLKTWKDEGDKQQKEIKEKDLKEELEKLYLWEVKKLSTCTAQILNGPSKEQFEALYEKLRKIIEKVNLKPISWLLEPNPEKFTTKAN